MTERDTARDDMGRSDGRMTGRRVAAIALALCMAILLPAASFASDGSGTDWTEDARARLRVGNPTGMEGKFFTGMWGGTTSDLDVQDLLHAYSPVRYDPEKGIFRFDRRVLQDAVVTDDEAGNRTYTLVFYGDLKWSDGRPVTARDYAFSILFCMDPAIRETGGEPMDYSWIDGADAYLSGESGTLAGLRVISDRILRIRVRADALPYFYEPGRLMIRPYPASAVAPGNGVTDNGDGARLTHALTADGIREKVLDPETGYLAHPTIVSGPYTLVRFDGTAAVFRINPYFKGTEEGMTPRIGEVEYTRADNGDMTDRLADGTFDLLNKVTAAEAVQAGLRFLETTDGSGFTADSYARTGLTMIRFTEGSGPAQEAAVRKAIAYCFDREGFTAACTGSYGSPVDGLYGIGQWMFRKADGERRLDGLVRYTPDPERAAALLEAAGWKTDGSGVRYKESGGGRTELRLKLALPESEILRASLEQYLVRPLEAAGIQVTMEQTDMEGIEKIRRGENRTADMVFLGENFSAVFDPEILAPREEPPADADPETHLGAALAEAYRLARETVRTEPQDPDGFLDKWIALQERISETLPLIPVYSNVYFDFYTRELHGYRITEAITWGEAIAESYMSDIGIRTENPGDAAPEQTAPAP